jgi:hypothetical protein
MNRRRRHGELFDTISELPNQASTTDDRLYRRRGRAMFVCYVDNVRLIKCDPIMAVL